LSKGRLRSFIGLMSFSAVVLGGGPPALAEGRDVPAPPLSRIAEQSLASLIEPAESLAESLAEDDDERMARVNQVDPNHVVPVDLLKKALHYYDVNAHRLYNKNYLSVVDFARHSGKGRFFVIDMRTYEIAVLHVAHGEGSDPEDTGYATRFSNNEGTLASSVGFYATAETYRGEYGYSLRLDGLSSTNSNARSRKIVLHGADDVYDDDRQPARSYGCFSVSRESARGLIDKLKGGSIIYAQRSETE